jgi:NADH:quinone reductase (non-electrogenic)
MPPFATRITELFGIDHPILCGGLMWLSDARYVAASVNAGGMGFITARTFPDPGAFRAELQKCRALTGGKSFGVNLYLTPRPEENVFLKGHLDILLKEGVRALETSGLPPKEFLPALKEAGAKARRSLALMRSPSSARNAAAIPDWRWSARWCRRRSPPARSPCRSPSAAASATAAK